MTPYLYFGANVSTTDALNEAWLAPDGTIPAHGSWAPASNSGNYCFWTSDKPLANVSSSQFGTWSVRVYANQTLLFSVQFTVTCTPAGAPAITFIDSAGAYGGYAYFASGSVAGDHWHEPGGPRRPAQSRPMDCERL